MEEGLKEIRLKIRIQQLVFDFVDNYDLDIEEVPRILQEVSEDIHDAICEETDD